MSLDQSQGFVLARSGVRGIHVSLQDTWLRIRAQADYPDPVAQLLAEACVAAALFTGNIRVEGRLSVQLNAHGPVPRLFAECTHEGVLRGLAHWHDPLPEPLRLQSLGRDRVLAINIESHGGSEPIRYQGMVPLEGNDLAAAFESYFDRSEQLPTRMMIAASSERAVGIMLQQQPANGHDAEDWQRADALLSTLTREELLGLEPERVLYRLFHEEEVRLLAETRLRFGCSCSRERVANVLRSLGHEEALAAAEQHGRAEIVCEFCGARYWFDRVDIEALFVDSLAGPGSERLQ